MEFVISTWRFTYGIIASYTVAEQNRRYSLQVKKTS